MESGILQKVGLLSTVRTLEPHLLITVSCLAVSCRDFALALLRVGFAKHKDTECRYFVKIGFVLLPCTPSIFQNGFCSRLVVVCFLSFLWSLRLLH